MSRSVERDMFSYVRQFKPPFHMYIKYAYGQFCKNSSFFFSLSDYSQCIS